MDELQEFCRKGLPITLNEEWDELEKAKQLLLENEYQPEPDEPNTFIKVSPKVEQPSESEPLQILFPDSEGKAEYKEVCGSVRHLQSGPRLSQSDILKRKGLQRIQFDTAKLSPHLQILLPANIPPRPPKQQKVAIRAVIDAEVESTESGLKVLLSPQLLSIGVRKSDSFEKNSLLGYYPCFARITFTPLFPDPSTVAIPIIYPVGSNPDADCYTRPMTSRRKKTGTKVGGSISGWGLVTVNAERSWENEVEEERNESENCKLVSVQADDDGNAACFEWKIVKWSEGEKYNEKKPHLGFRFSKMPNPPFGSGTMVSMREERFPVAEWHVDPGVKGFDSCLKFEVHIEVIMHIIWCAGSYPFFKSLESDAKSFDWRNTFQVQC